MTTSTTETKPAATAPELEGKPAATPSTPELVEVKVGDATLKLDKAAAEAITKYQESMKAAGVATASQLAELERQVKELAPKKDSNSQQAEPDLAQLVFTDPNKFVQLVTERISSSLNSQLTQTKAQEQFWSAFYDKNPELKAHDWVVKAVVARDYSILKPMTVDKAIEKLSETVKGDILKLAGKKHETDPATEIEGGNESSRKKSKESTTAVSEDSLGLSGIVRQRQEKRRAAARGAKAN